MSDASLHMKRFLETLNLDQDPEVQGTAEGHALRFLGVGNSATVELGSASAVIERDARPLLMIDCGQEALTAYLRGKFDNENIRVVMRPKKTDSVEAYIGDEFLGVLFAENEKGRRSYIFELPILDVDLEGGPVVVDD